MSGSNAFDARTLSWTMPKERGKHSRRQLDRLILIENYRKNFLGRFDWLNTDTNAGFIENILFVNGVAYYHRSRDYGGVFCTGGITGYNAQGLPTRFVLNYPNGKTETGTALDTVAIFDTPYFYNQYAMTDFLPPILLAGRYADVVADLYATAHTYSIGLKKPTFVPTTDKLAESNKQVAAQILQDHPFIFLENKAAELDVGAQVFHNSTHRAEDLNGILTARKTMYSEGLQRLGVRSTLLEKTAYQSDTDNDREDLSADLVLDLCYRSRLSAVEQIRKIGGDVRVNISQPLRKQPDATLTTGPTTTPE